MGGGARSMKSMVSREFLGPEDLFAPPLNKKKLKPRPPDKILNTPLLDTTQGFTIHPNLTQPNLGFLYLTGKMRETTFLSEICITFYADLP